MKVVCISDTHDVHYPELPEGDMLIHAGDVSLNGSPQEITRFLDWFEKQPHRHKIFVGGNHDRSLEQYGWGFFERKGITYLENSSTKIEGFKIFGSPASRTFGHICAFMREEEALRRLWLGLDGTHDIVITHSPAKWFRDSEADGVPLGSESLAEFLRYANPLLHVCGHIHGGYGQTEHKGTQYVNASHLDVTYRKFNAPIVVDLEDIKKKINSRP